MNKYVFDSDVAILIGHTQGNLYGGYSSWYKHCATGITDWKSISAHHVPQVMHRQDFVPVSTHSEMRNKFDQQGMYMKEKMGKKFFCCDAVRHTDSRQSAVYSGWAKEMLPMCLQFVSTHPCTGDIIALFTEFLNCSSRSRYELLQYRTSCFNTTAH